MKRSFIIFCFLFGIGMSLVAPPEGAVSVLLVLAVALPFLYIFRKHTEEKDFITYVFVGGLLIRLAFGFAIKLFNIKFLIAEDTLIYDAAGQRLVEIWSGMVVPNDYFTYRAQSTSIPGWGMHYLVAGIYFICGRSLLAAQSFCAVFGAATAPLVYFCAHRIFNNKNVAKLSALTVALFPSFIIWSSQLLKDGLIIFLLVLAMTMVLELHQRFNLKVLLLLIVSLGSIISLRFYIFYMVAISVAGSFVIGISNSSKTIFRRTVVLILLGLGLTYMGIIRNASIDFESYASLERVQSSRQNLAETESGFAEELDVSTPEGALSAIPIGFLYLFFAPFPWQVSNYRQALALPEVFIWWAMIPLLIYGLWYAIKHRLRTTFPILLFSLMLTLAYSIFQGNVGTAYRQRTQIQVFLVIFIAVGWTLFKEKKEDRKLLERARQKHFREDLQIRV